jgi:hypothetical protein
MTSHGCLTFSLSHLLSSKRIRETLVGHRDGEQANQEQVVSAEFIVVVPTKQTRK